MKDLVKTGEVQAEQAQQAVQDLVDRSRRSTEKFLELVRHEVRAQVASLGLASKKELARLEKRIDSLNPRSAATKAPAKKAGRQEGPGQEDGREEGPGQEDGREEGPGRRRPPPRRPRPRRRPPRRPRPRRPPPRRPPAGRSHGHPASPRRRAGPPGPGRQPRAGTPRRRGGAGPGGRRLGRQARPPRRARRADRAHRARPAVRRRAAARSSTPRSTASASTSTGLPGARRRRVDRRLHRLPAPARCGAGGGGRRGPQPAPRAAARRPPRRRARAHQRARPDAATTSAAAFDVVVADLSFISLRTVADAAARAWPARGPTWCSWSSRSSRRAGARLSEGRGVITDPAGVAPGARRGRRTHCEARGAAIMGVMVSPLRGAERQRRVPGARLAPGGAVPAADRPGRPRPRSSAPSPTCPTTRAGAPDGRHRPRRSTTTGPRPPTWPSRSSPGCRCPWARGPHRRAPTPTWSARPTSGVGPSELRRRARPGGEPRRRRHHAAHRRPAERRRASPCSA